MKAFYLGAFPPGYGGVTIKNKNLYEALAERIDIHKVDFNLVKRKNWKEIWRLITSLLGRENRLVIGVSGRKTRKRFTQLLYYLNRKAMKHSVILLMGGTAANDIVSDPEYLKCAKGYKMIYAETQGMIETLENAGLKNAGYYPNGRFKPKNPVNARERSGKLRCVFFSAVCPEKGADIVLSAAEQLQDISFVFYGAVKDEYRTEFEGIVNKLSNAEYRGIFTGNAEAVYRELSKFDVLLLPTRWKAEGVPGIFVEAKIAGVPIIASDQNYNRELIEDGEDGIVLERNDPDCLTDALRSLDKDRMLLQKMKKGSSLSAEQFYIENHIEKIIKAIGK